MNTIFTYTDLCEYLHHWIINIRYILLSLVIMKEDQLEFISVSQIEDEESQSMTNHHKLPNLQDETQMSSYLGIFSQSKVSEKNIYSNIKIMYL